MLCAMSLGPGGGSQLAISEVLIAAAGLIAGWAVVGLVGATGALPDGDVGQALGLIYGPIAVAVGAVTYWQVATRVFSAPGPGATTRLSAPKTALVVTIHVAAAVVGSEILAYLMKLAGFPVTEQTVVLDILRGGLGLRPPLIALCAGALVLAPLAEELFFRALLFRRIRRVAGRTPAYLYSAVGFALIHQNPVGLVIYAWLGLVFASALERSARPAAAVWTHVGNNAVALGILLVQTHAGTLPPP